MRKAFWKLAGIAVAAIALYTLAGYLLGPRLVRSWLETTVADSGEHRLVVDQIIVDPFALRVSLLGTALLNAEDRPELASPRADARIQPSGVASGELQLDQLTLYAPDVKLASSTGSDEHQWRLQAWLSQVAALVRTVPRPDHVDQLQVIAGRLRLGEPGDPDWLELTNLGLQVTNLPAGPTELSPFEMTADLNPGGQMVGSGGLHYGDGRLRIVGDFSADELNLGGSRDGDMRLTVDRLLATGVDVGTAQPAPSIDVVRVERPRASLMRSPEGRIDLPPWLDWLANPGDGSSAIHRAEVVDGQVRFTDRYLTPAVQVEVLEIEGAIETGASAATALDLGLEGRLAPAGTIRLAVVGQPATRVDLALQDVELARLSPYFEAAAGRGIRGGRLDLALRYTNGNGRADLDGRIVVEQLRLADRPAPDQGWPLALAVALLEDRAGRIDIPLPLRPGPVEPRAVPGRLLVALHDHISDLTAAPFEAMARIAGRPDENLDALPFEPGNAEIMPPAARRLDSLAAALMARPRLAIQVHPAHDPATDRQALAARQVRLHVALASSAPPGAAQQQPIELDDARVRDILDEFGATRLPTAAQGAISDRHPERDHAYYAALFDALVANEKVSDTALQRLARYRAQSVVDALRARGVPPDRLGLAETVETAAAHESDVMLRLEAHPADAVEPVALSQPGSVDP